MRLPSKGTTSQSLSETVIKSLGLTIRSMQLYALKLCLSEGTTLKLGASHPELAILQITSVVGPI